MSYVERGETPPPGHSGPYVILHTDARTYADLVALNARCIANAAGRFDSVMWSQGIRTVLVDCAEDLLSEPYGTISVVVDQKARGI